ncbi:hypothetical protein [Microbulbifer thermotolerans]|uniref:Uncharacterized protein n=1 Tax=Microbulbifer thermotolerans TaxID=252514 RepID=A0A143HNX9_MICTH|nr:hypothetical protein [Microbulbifer thermotolerans]AMX03140.1 hypothetical protein A3224_11650 [Microbulbifer thermotolerans]
MVQVVVVEFAVFVQGDGFEGARFEVVGAGFGGFSAVCFLYGFAQQDVAVPEEVGVLVVADFGDAAAEGVVFVVGLAL